MYRQGGVLGRILAIMLLCWSHAGEAANLGDFAQKLAGSSSRTWVYERVVHKLGPSGCVSGVTYTFTATHQLIVSVCKNGQMADTTYSWSMADSGSGDVILNIAGMGTFVLLFKDATDGEHLMRLRTKAGPQTDPVTDKEFSLEEN